MIIGKILKKERKRYAFIVEYSFKLIYMAIKIAKIFNVILANTILKDHSEH